MAKFGKSVLIGATIGVATAYFLNTRKGKEVKDKANEFITDWRKPIAIRIWLLRHLMIINLNMKTVI